MVIKLIKRVGMMLNYSGIQLMPALYIPRSLLPYNKGASKNYFSVIR